MKTFQSLVDKADEMKKAGQYDAAIGTLSYIQSASPESDAGLNATTLLSGIFKDLGQMDKAYTYMRVAVETLERRGDLKTAAGAYTSLACGSLYTPGITMAAYTELTQRISTLTETAAHRVSHLKHDMSLNRRLRVGILSPDFCMHSLAFLVAQPLMNFQRVSGHELYLYHLRPNIDRVSEQLQQQSTFVHVHGMSEDQIVSKITEDKIDVLIDISGYTAETRLGVFARQPAPVQMGWISGMMTPTGLRSIPYFITDAFMKPDVVAPELCTPVLVPTALTYHSLREKELDIGGLPCDRAGHIAFASFNNPCKVNREVLSSWAHILRKVPNSRLHLKTSHDLDAARIYEFLHGAGIEDKRLILMPPLPSSTDVQMYYSEKIDIFLDAWPCSGCLTTVEAMWVGVPVVSKYDDVFCSRQSHSILNNIGITDLSHPTTDAYIDSAVKLAQSTMRMRSLRKDLRGMISASPLHNYGDMAIALGKAIESAWVQTVTLRNSALDLLRKAA